MSLTSKQEKALIGKCLQSSADDLKNLELYPDSFNHHQCKEYFHVIYDGMQKGIEPKESISMHEVNDGTIHKFSEECEEEASNIAISIDKLITMSRPPIGDDLEMMCIAIMLQQEGNDSRYKKPFLDALEPKYFQDRDAKTLYQAIKRCKGNLDANLLLDYIEGDSAYKNGLYRRMVSVFANNPQIGQYNPTDYIKQIRKRYELKGYTPKPYKFSETHELVAVTGADLRQMKMPKTSFLVDNFIHQGLGILASDPKMGKSYFCLQLAGCIAKGEKFLGRNTTQAGVYYFDLESNKKRPKERLEDLFPSSDGLENLYISTADDNIPMIGEGFEESLRDAIEKLSSVKLVMIDVLQKLKPENKSRDDAYSADYRLMSPLQNLANELGITILLVTHTTKTKRGGFADISGSNGIFGSADFSIVLRKEEESSNVRLSYTSREISEFEEIIGRDPSGGWYHVSTPHELAEQIRWKEYEESILIGAIKKMVDLTGTLIANATELKNDAWEKFKISIPGTPQQIGGQINGYTDLLAEDGYSVLSKCSGKDRKFRYIITKSDLSEN